MCAFVSQPAETVLFDSHLVRIVTMRRGGEPALCPPKSCCVAFHRTPIGIEPCGEAPLVGNANFVTFHDRHRACRRFEIDSRGVHSDWFWSTPPSSPEARRFRSAALARPSTGPRTCSSAG